MPDIEDTTAGPDQKVTVEASGIDGIAAALGMELVEEPPDGDE